MQENEFEKKLQLKLDELKVQPADEVWLKIQAAVAKKNRRRRSVFFFFLITVLLTTGLLVKESSLWFHATPLSAVKQPENIATQTLAKKEGQNDAASSTATSGKPQPIVPTTDDNHPANTTTVNADAANATVTSQTKKQAGRLLLNVTGGSVETQQSNMSGDVTKHTYKKIKDKKKGSVTTNITTTVAEEDINEVAESGLAGIAVIPVTKETNTATSVNEQSQKNDQLLNKKATGDAVKEDSTTTVQQKKTAEKNNKKLWGVRLSFAAGMAATGNSYLSNSNLAQADYTAANPGNTPTAGNIFLPPSSVKNGYGVEVGINLYRQLSAKSKIAAGLSYQLLTTGNKIGARSDSAAALRQNVFFNGSQQSYTNYYHLLSIPVQFSTQLFTIAGKEINLDMGVNFSRLISTNSLQYNLGRLVYYQDNSLFNKNIIGLSAGVNIHLFPKNKVGYYIGPEFYYSLTPMASAGMYERSHYQFIGIRLQKNLKK